MKKILVSIDDDIAEILEGSGNKSAFIRKAILAEQDNNLTQEVRRLGMLIDGFVDDLQEIKETLKGQGEQGEETEIPIESPILGRACCLNKKTRCQHWQYNMDTGDMVNTLTGETMYA